MAEEILNTAITEESPIVESPIVESDATEETIPDGIENLKLLHTALSGDKEYVDLVPKDFNKFIEQYSDGENATLLFQSLRGDSEYSDMIPSDAVEAASMFGVTINPKSWGKPSAVPSASVDGGSATRKSGVVQPSSSQPNVDNQFGLGGIAAQVGKETELSKEVNAFGNYEDKQSYFVKVDKAKREIVDNKNSSYVLPNTEEGQRIYKDATGLRYDFLKREADAAQAKMSAALNPIINKDINEKYLTKNDDGFLVPDVEKIDQYAKDLAKRYGLPEDGFLKEVIYNEAKSMASYKELEPEVNRRFEKLIQPNLVATGLIEKSNQEVWKNFTTDEVEQAELDKKVGVLADDLKVKSKAEEDAIQYELGKQVSNLDMSYAQMQAQTTQQFENLDNQYKNGMPRQQYEAEFNKLQEASKQSYAAYSDDRLKLFDEGQKALNQISNKYNGQLRRQTEELNNIAREKVNKAALEYQKKYGKNPKLEAEIKKLYEKAYLETVDAKNNEVNKYNKNRATELVLKYKQFGGMAAMADRFLRSVDSAAGGSLKGLGTSLGINSLQVYGDFLQGSVTLPEAKTKEFKDLFDPLNLSQVSGQLAGGMAPMIAASAVVGAATRSAPVMYQMAATGAASFFTETADIAGRMHDETFAKTQSVAKANEASEKSWEAQYKIIPLYSFRGLPFINTAGTWIKTLPRVSRVALGAAAELLEEIPQEVTQNINEENIRAGLDPFDDYYKKISEDDWKRLKETAISVAPVALLGGAGQISGPREISNKRLMQQQVNSYAAQAKVNERIGNMQGQWVSQMVAKKGDAFAITTINALFTDGTIDEQTRNQLQEHVATSKKNFEDAKTLGLSESEGVVYDALTQAYLEKKAQYEQAQQNGDEILADNLNADMTNIRNQAKEFAQNKQGDFFVFQFADGSQKVVTNSKWSSDAQILELIASGQVGVSAYSENGKAILDSLNPKVEEQKLLQLERNNKVPQGLTDKIAQLRKQEQAEYDNMSNPDDEAKRKEIYDKYDKAITPLLEQQDALTAQEPVAEEVELESGLQGENAIVELQENNPELKDIPLSIIEENLGVGDMVYGNIVGQEVSGKVNNVGIHKGQIVVDIIDQDGNPRFLYSRNIERIEPKQKEVERLNSEQSKRRLELLNQEEITVDEINELGELGKISRGEIPNPSKALQAPVVEETNVKKKEVKAPTPSTNKNVRKVSLTLDASKVALIRRTPIFQQMFSKEQMSNLKEGDNILELNQTAWGKVSRQFGENAKDITNETKAPVVEVKVEVAKESGYSPNDNIFNKPQLKNNKTHGWRTMSESEFNSLSTGEKTYEGGKPKSGNWIAGVPQSAAKFGKKGTVMVEFGGINMMGAENMEEGTTADKSNVTKVWRFNEDTNQFEESSDLLKNVKDGKVIEISNKKETPQEKQDKIRNEIDDIYDNKIPELINKLYEAPVAVGGEGMVSDILELQQKDRKIDTIKEAVDAYFEKLTKYIEEPVTKEELIDDYLTKEQKAIINEIQKLEERSSDLEDKISEIEEAEEAKIKTPKVVAKAPKSSKVVSLEDYDGTTDGEVKLSDTVSIKKDGDSYYVTANDVKGDTRTYSPMTLKEAKVFAENQLLEENKGENINLNDYSTKEIRANELKIGDVYSRTIGSDRYVFELLSNPMQYNGQFYTAKVRVLDVGSFVNKKEIEASGNIKKVSSRVVGETTIDSFKDLNLDRTGVKFGKVTLINDFNKNEAPTEQAKAEPQVQEVEQYKPITIKEIYHDNFSKENAMYYDEGERELDSGRMSIYVASMTMDITNDDGDSIGALTKLVDDDKNVTWNGEDYEGSPLSDDDFESMNEAKQAIVDRWNKKQKKEFDKQAKKAAKEQEKAELKAAKAEARAKAKSESKAPKAKTKATEITIFNDFDASNKGRTIKAKAEANKAFKEKYGEDAAVAKAISSNFEAVADELKAKGIFTKIEC